MRLKTILLSVAAAILDDVVLFRIGIAIVAGFCVIFFIAVLP